MYYNKKKMIVSIFWVILGATLMIFDIIGITDNSICAGMGGGWLAIGVMQIYKNLKYNSNETYKEKIDIAFTDERNRYIRMKAWSWAGYLFVILAAITSIVLFIMKQNNYGQILSYCTCSVLALYLASYIFLQKKN